MNAAEQAICCMCSHPEHLPAPCPGRSEWCYPTVIDGVDVSGEDAGPCVCEDE